MEKMKQATFVLFVLLASMENAFGQSDALTDCAKLDFKTLHKTCCVRPSNKIFPMVNLTATTKTCKANSRLMSWLNAYKINELQIKSNKNFIDTTNQATQAALCIYGAFVECVFKQNLWLDGSGTILVRSVMDHMKRMAKNDTDWESAYFQILNFFTTSPSTFADNLFDSFESIQCASQTVNLMPLMMAQIIQSRLIRFCPEQAPYTAVNMCSETMNNYYYCDAKIYSHDGNGIFCVPS